MSMSFYPQMDGQTEQANCSVSQILTLVVQLNQRDWVDWLDMTEFTINMSMSETIKFALFELSGGYITSML